MRVRMLKQYGKSDLPRVEALLEEWTCKPLAGHYRWPASLVTSLCQARVRSLLDGPHSVAWVVDSGGPLNGFAALSHLQWDSDQLGLAAARLDYLVAVGSYEDQCSAKQLLVSQALEYCLGQRIQHLSVRVDAADVAGLHALEQAGFVTVDGLLTFAADMKHLPVMQAGAGFNIRFATPDDAERTAGLARHAYTHDRFHADPAISTTRADDLHAAWLRNSCAGTAADAVVIAEDKGELLGFVTCKVQRDMKVHLGKLVGTIVLVGTGENARGKGVGRAMTLAAIEWFRQQGTEIVEVGTQLRNIAASRLYQNCGFRLVGSSVALRALLPLQVKQILDLKIGSASTHAITVSLDHTPHPATLAQTGPFSFWITQ